MILLPSNGVPKHGAMEMSWCYGGNPAFFPVTAIYSVTQHLHLIRNSKCRAFGRSLVFLGLAASTRGHGYALHRKQMRRVKELKTRELRRLLDAAGANTRGCFDRESLLDILDQDPAILSRCKALQSGEASPEAVQVTLHKSKDEGLGPGGIVSDGDHYMSIDLEIGKKLARFVLDTGASHSVMRDKDVQKFGGRRLNIPVTAQGGTGLQQGLGLASLGEVSIGGLVCGPLQVITTTGELPGSDSSGILGLDFLLQVVLQLDFRRSCLKLGLSKHLPNLASIVKYLGLQDMTQVPLQKLPGNSELFGTPLRLKSSKGRAEVQCLGVIDLGAPFTVCSKATALALGLPKSELKNSGKFVTGMDGNPVEVVSARLKLAAATLEVETEVFIGDLPIFQALGVAVQSPIVILGLDVMQHRGRVAMATSLQTLWM